MMSYLGRYPGARSQPIPKFNRAVQSFVNQTFKDCELIIVSDGCEITNKEYEANWADHQNITLIKTEKSKDMWPGVKRQMGREKAKGEWIIYLDADDVYTPTYLQAISKELDDKYDAIFNNGPTFGDSRVKMWKFDEIKGLKPKVGISNLTKSRVANTEGDRQALKDGGVGTCSIIHKNSIKNKWGNTSRRGEDCEFSKDIANSVSFTIINIRGYVICHDPNFKLNHLSGHLDV